MKGAADLYSFGLGLKSLRGTLGLTRSLPTANKKSGEPSLHSCSVPASDLLEDLDRLLHRLGLARARRLVLLVPEKNRRIGLRLFINS